MALDDQFVSHVHFLFSSLFLSDWLLRENFDYFHLARFCLLPVRAKETTTHQQSPVYIVRVIAELS